MKYSIDQYKFFFKREYDYLIAIKRAMMKDVRWKTGKATTTEVLNSIFDIHEFETHKLNIMKTLRFLIGDELLEKKYYNFFIKSMEDNTRLDYLSEIEHLVDILKKLYILLSKEEALMEKELSLTESCMKETIMTIEEFMDAIEEIYYSYFPESYFVIQYSTNIATSIQFNTALGKDKTEWNNKIFENDPMSGKYFIWGIKDGNLGEVLTLETSSGGSVSLKDPTGRMFSISIKFFRKVSGSPEKILIGIEKMFEKAHNIVEENIDNFNPVNFDIKSKL